MTGVRRTTVTAALALLAGALSLAFEGSVSANGTAQLRPLAVADGVTLRARPTVVSVATGTRVTLFGSIDPGRAGEDIKIQAKDCGLDFFRVVAGAITKEGGEWSTFYFGASVNTTLRAVWRDAISDEVAIRRRATIIIRKRTAKRFEVAVGGAVWRKRASVQRFDPRLGTWSVVRSVVLADDYGLGARATFTLVVPKGTLVRAVFPRSQAGPCYLPGTSNSLRT
ncbi:MAG: hypothetical protein M3546_14570 [Actinomycetota bacterium]|nr:hypothetical protein [Actinomycetota bacterium]